MSAPVWKGLFEYSMRHSDGTKPSNFKPEDLDLEKMKWLDEALKSYMVDFATRMVEIKKSLDKDDESVSLENREELLDELMDIVSSIDYARDLHTIGGLPTLLDLLSSPHPSLRSKAAEVIATCVANNPPVQQWFLDGGVLPLLLTLLASDPSPSVRTKALLALSSLVREHAPSLAAFRASPTALPSLVAALRAADEPRLQRKAANLLQYVISSSEGEGPGQVSSGGTNGSSSSSAGAGHSTAGAAAATAAAAVGSSVNDISGSSPVSGVDVSSSSGAGEAAAQAAVADGVLPPLLAAVSDSDDPDLREAALKLLLQLAEGAGTWGSVKGLEGLGAALENLLQAHDKLSGEDREAVAEEFTAGKALQALLAQTSAPERVRPQAGVAAAGRVGSGQLQQQQQQQQQPVLALCGP